MERACIARLHTKEDNKQSWSDPSAKDMFDGWTTIYEQKISNIIKSSTLWSNERDTEWHGSGA
ncbi:Hypothetical protein FKW44_002219 [Caligus rogercresseyi]|uniref:Uncharacterized protein n=1 Tax=Caligus rogercresseyi TaxID=217165 RepID=A0A7T8QW60_CALRO|nr:Hypothetical protein FKW44_002219 [Caligus rogercresseyi]